MNIDILPNIIFFVLIVLVLCTYVCIYRPYMKRTKNTPMMQVLQPLEQFEQSLEKQKQKQKQQKQIEKPRPPSDFPVLAESTKKVDMKLVEPFDNTHSFTTY